MEQFQSSIERLSSDQQGVFVACILLASAISSLLSGHVADSISRRYGIMIGAALTLIGTMISASAPNFAALIVARLVTGFGMGQAIAVTTVYLVELAPTSIRGVAACMLQTYVVLGITTGYFVSYGSQYLLGSIAWRTPFILQACVASILAVGMLFLPFSPRWLCQKGRIDDARKVLLQLRDHTTVEHELGEIRASLSAHNDQEPAAWLEMFNKRYLGRTLLGIFLMTFQQLTGVSQGHVPRRHAANSTQIDVVLYYAPILFQQAGFSSKRSSFLASGVCGLVMLAATVPAQIWIDRWGRRTPLVTGGALMSVCLLAIGAIYSRLAIHVDGGLRMDSKAGQWAVTALTYVFIANFSWSWAVVRLVLITPYLKSSKLTIREGWQDLRRRNHSYSSPRKGT